uniref:Uncharacterized protein n=1 Tax=Minutocellus polymorphus TaxID=265543 RepID=A0A6U4FUV3_9STRA|mmetsp:Transcript_13853/g.23035  ORF Transcript_13853/g.23035 Transcript_13853/m.23035 type:complete len:127 (+) Transcript_13853:261-641(+)
MADSSIKRKGQTTESASSSSSDQLQSLAKDYATISKLMVQLNAQVKTMTQSVGTMVRSVPAHDGLSATLEALGDSSASGDARSSGNGDGGRQSKKSRMDDGGDEEDDAVIMGDEASAEKDDPLMFL